MENNKRNSADSTAADSYFENIQNQEKDFSVVTKLSLKSLFDLNAILPRGARSVATFQGLTVSKSKSHPIKYCFQMENQISVKLSNDDVKSALSFFILEPLSDPSKCSNKQNCFEYNDFCICNQYLPVRIKLVMMSEEEEHQNCAKEWANKIKEIFGIQKPNCPGFYLSKTINILKNTFESTMRVHDVKDDKESSKKILSLMKTTSRKRKVMDKVSSLLGFAVKPVDKDDEHSKVDPHSYERPVITNHAPRDFCEICWISFSETGEGQI